MFQGFRGRQRISRCLDMDIGYPGQDFLSRALVIVYSPISNLRHENGVGVKRQLISINYYLHMNADK